MKTTYNIQAILKGCLDKNPKAQRALVDSQGDRLYAICVRYIGNKERAKDALQESFIRIFKYIDKYDPSKGNFESWINTIAIRQCLRMLDKKLLQSVELDNDLHGDIVKEPEAIQKMNRDDLLLLVSDLPDGYRQIFNLSVIEGYSHSEIAELIGLKESSSRSKLSRAKDMLRTKITFLKLRNYG